MRRKYQIFISSTYIDLIEERKAVQDAILKLDHLPVGMEAFGARSKSQWDVIKKTIDSSDYYVLIIGYRYGSIAEDGIGYTEKEFRYARDKGIPIIAFVKEEGLPITKKDIETLPEMQEKLSKFIESVKDNREVAWWRTKDELCNKVITSLYKEFNENERCGWIRQDDSYNNNSLFNGIAFSTVMESVDCQNIYFDLTSDQRNIAKRNQIKKTQTLRLHARTGYSFIAKSGTFYSSIRESLNRGMDFQIIIQNLWSLNALFLILNSYAFDNKDDFQEFINGRLSCEKVFSIYKHSDWHERFKMCLKGFQELKREFGDRIELKLSDIDMSNSILLSDESLFFEPSMSLNIIGNKSLSLFELEFIHTSKLYEDCENVFNFVWEQSYEYQDFIKEEAHFIEGLKMQFEMRNTVQKEK